MERLFNSDGATIESQINFYIYLFEKINEQKLIGQKFSFIFDFLIGNYSTKTIPTPFGNWNFSRGFPLSKSLLNGLISNFLIAIS